MIKKSVGILMVLLMVVLCFGAAGEAAVSSNTVTLTVTPSSNLLLYQGVTYAISAKDATNVSLVFVEGEYEDEIRLDEFMKPDPIVIRFSNLDMVAFISPPILYKITEGEDPIDMPDFTDLEMDQSEMTCETADLEAGTYWFEFFGAPSEDGYTECRVVVEVTVTE